MWIYFPPFNNITSDVFVPGPAIPSSFYSVIEKGTSSPVRYFSPIPVFSLHTLVEMSSLGWLFKETLKLYITNHMFNHVWKRGCIIFYHSSLYSVEFTQIEGRFSFFLIRFLCFSRSFVLDLLFVESLPTQSNFSRSLRNWKEGVTPSSPGKGKET